MATERGTLANPCGGPTSAREVDYSAALLFYPSAL